FSAFAARKGGKLKIDGWGIFSQTPSLPKRFPIRRSSVFRLYAGSGSGAQRRKTEDRRMGNLFGSDGVCVSGSRSGSWADRRLVREQFHRVLFCGGHGGAGVRNLLGMAS